MFKKLLANYINKSENSEAKAEPQLKEYISKYKTAKESLLCLEKQTDEYSYKVLQDLKQYFRIPLEILIEMNEMDIVFYILNFYTFKDEIEKQPQEQLDILFKKITTQDMSFLYTMEEGINLLTFYGEYINAEGANHIVNSILEQAHGDMGVYTTMVKMLAELNQIEALEIVYSAISHKYGEEVAIKLLERLNIDVSFAKSNKIFIKNKKVVDNL